STCNNPIQIDISFDVSWDGIRFARCLNVPIGNWDASSTPSDFAYCRKEFARCSLYNPSHASGVCVRSNAFCRAAQQYCATLKGDFQGMC
ncbi:hypothetical protein JAAARDRAFT_119813, partial [Jaapia argillacea MUCL 33604]